ncbi:MAG: SDR family oxidoreductase [Saprospiraceae bacterium]|nr:SDR family oxidoreductase [Saprospiraceae bacterium]
MKILITGATGYIGKRLTLALVNQGHDLVCCVRDKNRFSPPSAILPNLEVIEVDFLNKASLSSIPKDIDGGYYLMHSMSSSTDYDKLELISAINFREAINKTKAQHVVYLSGIINQEPLSKHLASRKAVEDELAKGDYHFTSLRAGIIIGSGSASFEIIRDLVEKLPIMIVPMWLKTRCQPISIQDVLHFLSKTLLNPATFDQNFDIGGPDILTYKSMLLGYAGVRGLRRHIYMVPVMTRKLSTFWLYFVTSTSHKLASALVESMTVEVVCRNDDLNQILGIKPIGYKEALTKTLLKIEQQQIISSWKDSLISGRFDSNISEFLSVPTHGCFFYKRQRNVMDREECLSKIWRLGGETGWYYANWLWEVRGFIDKIFGGVGLRRGRTHINRLSGGDAIDFWRVLYSNRDEGRLLLFAEMKLPGEAWLEFKLSNGILYQKATFRPKGIVGRIYWYTIYPMHGLVFRGLLNQLSK